MRDRIHTLLQQSLARVAEETGFAGLADFDPQIERTRDSRHGDFTSNVAMRAAKSLGANPRELAAKIAAAVPLTTLVTRAEVAGPGFLNLTLSNTAFQSQVVAALEQGDSYGRSDIGKGRRVLVEYVSANPTGPLHVGHGRHAAFGASLASLLRATGHDVDEEYYVNDAGRQMDILAVSVWLRYLEDRGLNLAFPSNCYQADYCKLIAADVAARHGRELTGDVDGVAHILADVEGDPEDRLDSLIAFAKAELGADGFALFFDAAIEDILGDIRNDLQEFGVSYDRWYSEKSLSTSGAIDRALAALEQRGLLYERDGATWFRTTDFGDDKDRVVIRENGARTYFASDIAYHKEKCERGYDLLLNCLGSDHHGYVARVRAALAGFDKPVDILEVQLVQFVILFRGREKVQMTTRGGTYVTLRDLRNEVGNDAARFFYVSRSNDQHLDFDLELAKSQSNDNPVYYVQYAHARIASMLRKLADDGFTVPAASVDAVAALALPEEIQLMRQISRFSEVVQAAAQNRAPQTLVQYLRDVAADFHSFYNVHRIIIDNEAVRSSRALLVRALQHVLANGLGLLGVSAPTAM